MKDPDGANAADDVCGSILRLIDSYVPRGFGRFNECGHDLLRRGTDCIPEALLVKIAPALRRLPGAVDQRETSIPLVAGASREARDRLAAVVLQVKAEGALTAKNLVPYADIVADAMNERAGLSPRFSEAFKISAASVKKILEVEVNVLGTTKAKDQFGCDASPKTISIMNYRILQAVDEVCPEGIDRHAFWPLSKDPQFIPDYIARERKVYGNILGLLDKDENRHIQDVSHMPKVFKCWGGALWNDYKRVAGRVVPASALTKLADALNCGVEDIYPFKEWAAAKGVDMSKKLGRSVKGRAAVCGL